MWFYSREIWFTIIRAILYTSWSMMLEYWKYCCHSDIDCVVMCTYVVHALYRFFKYSLISIFCCFDNKNSVILMSVFFKYGWRMCFIFKCCWLKKIVFVFSLWYSFCTLLLLYKFLWYFTSLTGCFPKDTLACSNFFP